MVNIFATLKYSEDRHVAIVAFQFQGVNRSWWNVIQNIWSRKGTPWTWANFIKVYNDKYIPLIIQENREYEFVNLKQGMKLVAECEA